MKLSESKYQSPLVVSSVSDPIRFRPANIVPALWMATAIYLPFSIFFVLVSSFHEHEPELVIIHLGSAISLLVFWKRIHWGEGRYDTFGAALLLFYAFFKVQAALDFIFYGSRIDQIYHTVPLPESLIWLFLKSEALNHFGILLLVAVWRQTVGIQVAQFSFLNNHHQVGRQLPKMVYVGAIVIELARRVAGYEFGVLSQFSGMLFQFGVVAIYFIATALDGRHRQVMMALVMALPMVFLALGTGMKENLIFPLVPALLIAWFRFRSMTFKATFIVLVFVLLSYSQLYVKYVRQVSWGPSGQVYTTAEKVSGFQEALKSQTLSEGMNSMSSRINMTTSRAITIAISDARGFEPYNIFAPILGSLIPRFLWSGKPVLQPGAQHTLRIHNLKWKVSDAWSATAAGFFSELYLGGGYIGWLVGIVIYATLIGKLQIYSLRIVPGFGHLALSFLTLYWAIRFDEKHVVYAFTSIIFTFVFIIMIAKFVTLMPSERQ